MLAHARPIPFLSATRLLYRDRKYPTPPIRAKASATVTRISIGCIVGLRLRVGPAERRALGSRLRAVVCEPIQPDAQSEQREQRSADELPERRGAELEGHRALRLLADHERAFVLALADDGGDFVRRVLEARRERVGRAGRGQRVLVGQADGVRLREGRAEDEHLLAILED